MERINLNFIYFIFLPLLLFGCDKNVNDNLTDSINFVENVKSIKDTIVKSRNSYTKLIVCTLKKMNDHNIITLSYPDTTYWVSSNFDYKEIESTKVLFIDFTDKKIDQAKREKVNNLVAEKIISFEKSNWVTHPPFYKFAFCKKDYKKIKCFDNIMENLIEQKCLNSNIKYEESLFYPDCK